MNRSQLMRKSVFEKAAMVGLLAGLLLLLPMSVDAASVASLVEQLKSKSTRTSASKELRKIGAKALPELYKLIRTERAGTRPAAELIAQMGPKGTPYLLRAIPQTKRWTARWEIVYALRFLGQDPNAVKGLKLGLKDPHKHVRLMTIRAIRDGKYPGSAVLPMLLKGTLSTESTFRYNAYLALVKYAPSHPKAFSAILALARSKEANVESRLAVNALPKLHNKYPKKVVVTLFEIVHRGLGGKNAVYSSTAMDALVAIGWKKLRKWPKIKQRLGFYIRTHKSPWVVRAIFVLLKKAHGKEIKRIQQAIQSAKSAE